MNQELIDFEMNSDHLHELAVRLYNANDLSDAYKIAYHLHLVDPFNSRSYKMLGIVNQAMEEYHRAIGAYQRAMLLKPTDTEVLFYLAQCQTHVGGYAKAKQWLEACLALDPGHQEALLLLPLVTHKIS